MNHPYEIDWNTLPAPEDDGATAHLAGTRLPALSLRATDGTAVELANLTGRTVVYVYPMTGQPGTDMPDGWDAIPGARGCTPQSCSFRDHYEELQQLGVDQLYGLSTQTSDYQREAAERLHLPFVILSDADYALTDAISLPTFTTQNADGVIRLLKRLALIIDDGVITHCFYPVFPPDQNAQMVIDWLKARLA